MPGEVCCALDDEMERVSEVLAIPMCKISVRRPDDGKWCVQADAHSRKQVIHGNTDVVLNKGESMMLKKKEMHFYAETWRVVAAAERIAGGVGHYRAWVKHEDKWLLYNDDAPIEERLALNLKHIYFVILERDTEREVRLLLALNIGSFIRRVKSYHSQRQRRRATLLSVCTLSA